MAIEIRVLTNEAANEGFTLDLVNQGDFPLALNYNIKEATDIISTSSTFSKTFRVPSTKENDKNLNSLYYSSTDNDSGLKGLLPCILYDNSIPIFKGQFKVRKVLRDRGGRFYECILFGTNYKWINDFKDVRLRDLDFSSEDHTFNELINSTWTDGSGNPASSDDRSYVYPVINYGKFSRGRKVHNVDLRPALFIRSILDKAFETSSSEYTISSTFLDSTFFKRLIMPFTNGAWEDDENVENGEEVISMRFTPYIGEQIIEKTSTVNTQDSDYSGSGFNFIRKGYSTGTLGNVSYVSGESYYTEQAESVDGFTGSSELQPRIYLTVGKHRIQHKARIQYDSLTFLEGAAHNRSYPSFRVLYQLFDVDGSSTPWTVHYQDFEVEDRVRRQYFDLDTDFVRRYNNDFMTISVVVLASPLQKYKVRISAIPESGSTATHTLEINKLPDVVFGSRVRLNKTLPDTTAGEFFKGLVHAFNLHVYTDEWLKKIYIEPRDTFYDFNNTLDWTDKLDLSSGYNFDYINDIKRTLLFQYKEDSNDALVTNYNDTKNTIYGAGEYDLNTRFAEGEQIYSNPFFAATIHNQVNINTIKDDLPINRMSVLPTMWDKVAPIGEGPAPSYDYEPRILLYDYSVQTDRQGNTINWIYRDTVSDEIPTGYFLDKVAGITRSNYNFSFGGSNGLIGEYYNGTINTIEEGVRLRARFALTREDIQTFDPRKPIYLSQPSQIQGYYVVSKIVDLKPDSKRPVSVILQKTFLENDQKSFSDKYYDDSIKWGTGDKWTDVKGDQGNIFTWARDDERIREDTGDITKLDTETDNWITEKVDEDVNATKLALDAATSSKASISLSNGTGNFVSPNSGSLAIGQGTEAHGQNQTMMGRYPARSATDIWGLGIGTQENRQTALSINEDGRFKQYGGIVYMEDENGRLIEVITEVDGEYDKVYLSNDES